MTIALIQALTSGYGSPLAETYPSNNTAGNALIVLVATNATTNTINGVGSGGGTDSFGNTWVLITQITTGGGNSSAIWFCASCVGGANTITIGGTGIGAGNTNFTISEFSGINTFDTGTSQIGGSTGLTTFTTNAVTTSYPNELLIGYASSGSAGLGINSPFSVLGTNENFSIMFYDIVSSLQTGTTATGPIGATVSGFYSYGLVTFYQAQAGSVLFDAMDF